MARKQLGALLDVASSPGQTPVIEEPAPRQERQAARPAEKSGDRSPRYSDYTRIEGRLRDDQVSELDSLARNLNRWHSGKGERITKNTLLRVAVDLLLAKTGNLDGSTEQELRRSAGL